MPISPLKNTPSRLLLQPRLTNRDQVFNLLAWTIEKKKKGQNIQNSNLQFNHQVTKETWYIRNNYGEPNNCFSLLSSTTFQATDQGDASLRNPAAFLFRRCSWETEESQANRVHRKTRELCKEVTPEMRRRCLSNLQLSIDQHMSIRKWPERIRNNSASPHTRPMIVLLPSTQTEPPQNSPRTGQSTQKVQGSIVGNS